MSRLCKIEQCAEDAKTAAQAAQQAADAAQEKAEAAAKQPRFVYNIAGERGFTWETWGPRDGTQPGDLEGFEAQWGGPVVNGIPTHVDGDPTTSGVETDTRFAQSERGNDDHRLCYWVYNDRSVAIEIQDTDTRAESLRVYAGCDCPSVLVHEHYQVGGGGAPYHSQGVRFLTIPPGGLVKMTTLIHDPGADFSGFRPIANEVGNPDATFDPTTYQARPVVECVEIEDDACDRYQLREGESFKPIEMNCHDCGSDGGESLSEEDVLALVGPHVEPATAAPTADNEADAAIRTGQVGTSLEYARADHNHPIRRQANPGDPVLTAGGNATLVQSIILDRWSTEETYEYAFRNRVQQDEGTGWGWINVPNIAGFQRPQILPVNGYRFPSTTPQLDGPGGQGGDGAAPRGPVMNMEIGHWSSTQRVYMAYFRREANIDMYSEFVVRYIRT